MKKKNYFYLAALSLAMTFSMGACSDNDDPTPDGGGKDPVSLDYSSENAVAWGNYMYNVAMLLNNDATTLYNSWVTDYVDEQGSHGPYATIFKDQTAGAYQSPLSCIEEMIESGMWNIANEVGDAKIKDPYTKYTSGDKEGGLYAVESWYSWHSRDDYTNNIFSIRNTYYGRIDDNDVSKVDGNLSAFNSYKDFDDEGDIAEHSLSKLIASTNPDLDEEIKTLIFASAKAIQAIPQPFRNNIDSEEAVAAMNTCMELANLLLNEVKPYVNQTFGDPEYDDDLDAIAEQFVDAVVAGKEQAFAGCGKPVQTEPEQRQLRKGLQLMDYGPRTVGKERSFPYRTGCQLRLGPEHGQLASGPERYRTGIEFPELG